MPNLSVFPISLSPFLLLRYSGKRRFPRCVRPTDLNLSLPNRSPYCQTIRRRISFARLYRISFRTEKISDNRSDFDEKFLRRAYNETVKSKPTSINRSSVYAVRLKITEVLWKFSVSLPWSTTNALRLYSARSRASNRARIIFTILIRKTGSGKYYPK